MLGDGTGLVSQEAFSLAHQETLTFLIKGLNAPSIAQRAHNVTVVLSPLDRQSSIRIQDQERFKSQVCSPKPQMSLPIMGTWNTVAMLSMPAMEMR